MKPTFKDYLSIALALLAIFLCGYGIGFLLGERKGLKSAPSPPPAPPAESRSIGDWEDRTLKMIQESGALTPDQLSAVEVEITASSARIEANRRKSLETYRDFYEDELRELHQRLREHLDPAHWEKLQTPPTNGGRAP